MRCPKNALLGQHVAEQATVWNVQLISETNCVDGDDLASGAVGLHDFGVRP